MSQQRSKQEIAEDIKTSYGSRELILLSEFLSCLILEARQNNDDAERNDVLLNQGWIKCCKEIARYTDINISD